MKLVQYCSPPPTELTTATTGALDDVHRNVKFVHAALELLLGSINMVQFVMWCVTMFIGTTLAGDVVDELIRSINRLPIQIDVKCWEDKVEVPALTLATEALKFLSEGWWR